jgi:hypothetical protein
MLPPRSFLTSLALGAVTGALFLGVGGRIAMRIFAVLDGRVPGWSVGGTMTVIFMGAAWGTLGGAVLWLGRRLFPATPLARGLLFWGVIALIAANLITPRNADSLIAFVPVALLYGVVLYRIWCRRFIARWQSLPGATPATAPPS